MNINIECIPCYYRQALQAARFATDDESLWWATLRNLGDYLKTLDATMASHDVAETAHRIIRESTGCADPYKKVKVEFNRRALAMLPRERGRVLAAADPLDAALRMSIAGNVIDFGSEAFLDLDETIGTILEKPFAIDHGPAFHDAVKSAKTVLFLGDNAGEIVFDKLLLEQLAPRKIFFAVRGAPILNDATPPDARDAGIHELAEIIDSGLAVAGMPLDRLPRRYLDIYNSADVVISKGQANFESLCEQPKENLFMLFTIKCELVARRTRTRVGDIVLAQGGRVELYED